MIKAKLYLYDSTREEFGYRGEGEKDLSKYVLQGLDYTEDIRDTLDVSEITIAGYPVRKEFEPSTKFILDLYQVSKIGYGEEVEEIEDLKYTYHLVVNIDNVEQPIISDNGYFNHHISFYEPSVIAQQRLVDNSSVTYKLKYVNLNTVTEFNINEQSITKKQTGSFSPANKFGHYSSGFLNWYSINCTGKYFEFDGNIEMLTREQTSGGSINLYQKIDNYLTQDGYFARFKIPKAKIMLGASGGYGFNYIGDASLVYTIQEFDLNDYNTPTNTIRGEIISNSNLNQSATNYLYSEISNITSYMPASFRRNCLIESWNDSTMSQKSKTSYRTYTNADAPAPVYYTPEIEIKNNKRYTIEVALKDFGDKNLTFGGVPVNASNPRKYFYIKIGALDNAATVTDTAVPDVEKTCSCSFQTYSTAESKILLQASNPYSALGLLQKAIVTSSLVPKKKGVFIGDINNMDIPFYVDEQFESELSYTQIIENFYNQKNLWEIMLEIGKYIHAVPELKFGKDDKFLITFNRLGETNQEIDMNTKVNVMNFKGIDTYISACSSYITNMVQLNGSIEEWVAPKTDNTEALVYNDTCSIITSKPIIELLDINVKCVADGYGFAPNGSTAPITDYVYEENVYKILSVNFTDIPNKGIALYYSLGNNKIEGCNYRNPTENTGSPQNDYAIKKIIFLAFNGGVPEDWSSASGWQNIKVNDFVFHITYRTKDSVRQNQTRPDLRKYMLNSKYDKVPQHNQFNNQTDTLVDSVKFGNNIYGTLIRTGNSTYIVREWTKDLSNLKHKGQLYRIKTETSSENGDLYYVAKAKHTIFNSYVLSEIEYSKDYNQLSPIIGIPSEPRFYEISEQSYIRREVAISDYMLLTDKLEDIDTNNSYLKTTQHLSSLMFGGEGGDFAKYAITVFKGDKNTDPNDVTQGSNQFYIEILSPLNAYSSENTLTYEWDMADNLSAGDKIADAGYVGENTADNAYRALKAVQYTDIYGKSPLMDFYIIEEIGDLNPEQIRNMPESPFKTKYGANEDSRQFVGTLPILATNVEDITDTDYNGRGLGLLKDSREVININYNEELLTSSDTFVISPFVFTPNKENVRVVLLKDEINKLSSGYIDTSSIIVPIDINGHQLTSRYFELQPNTELENGKAIEIPLSSIFENINPNHFGDQNGEDVEGFDRVRGIAIVYDVVEEDTTENVGIQIAYKTKFIIGRNIPNIEGFYGKENVLKSFVIGAPNKDAIFTNKQ